MKNTYSESFRKAREAALVRGDASAYNAFDGLYNEAVKQERLEAEGKICVFNNVMGA